MRLRRLSAYSLLICSSLASVIDWLRRVDFVWSHVPVGLGDYVTGVWAWLPANPWLAQLPFVVVFMSGILWLRHSRQADRAVSAGAPKPAIVSLFDPWVQVLSLKDAHLPEQPGLVALWIAARVSIDNPDDLPIQIPKIRIQLHQRRMFGGTEAITPEAQPAWILEEEDSGKLLQNERYVLVVPPFEERFFTVSYRLPFSPSTISGFGRRTMIAVTVDVHDQPLFRLDVGTHWREIKRKAGSLLP